MKSIHYIYLILVTIVIIYLNDLQSNHKLSDSKISNIIEKIHENYVDSINYNTFENSAINSILSELDPHSSYIAIEDVKH